MKTLYLIGGPMGVGKTSVCQQLKIMLPAAVFLDGDWCWDMHPFQVTAQTKQMVLQNICFLLNQFLHCSAYETIIFCWVMHEQVIVDTILSALDTGDCKVKAVSLVCDEATLKRRLQRDIDQGLRTQDVIARSLDRLPLYEQLNTIKPDTSHKSIAQTCGELIALK